MYVTGDKVTRETAERATEGGTPLSYSVSYKVGGGESCDGVLESSSQGIRLISSEGADVLSTPLDALSDVSFPRLRSGRIEFVAGGVSYEADIVLSVWSQESSEAGEITGIFAAAGKLVGPLESRMLRAECKRVFDGEAVPEEVKAEDARRLMENSGWGPGGTDLLTGEEVPADVVEVPTDEEG